jgi:zinc D-Ala-D-Ala carboxypeptidase
MRTLHYPHWKDAVPDWRWANFSPYEMRCRCEDSAFEAHCQCAGSLVIAPQFLDRLQALRDRLGFPMVVTSGYRSAEYDQAIGGAGVHPEGCAVDVAINGEQAYKMLVAASKMEFWGIGLNQRGKSRFIHLDNSDEKSRPRVWTY